KRLV
ncbi:trehalose-6-phosphate hydrolase, partial [Vibrio parahaemolyticus V-223/04]